MRTHLPFTALSVLLFLCAGGPAFGHSQPKAGASFAFDHYVTDAGLHRRWAILADRAHPERPWIAVPAASSATGPEGSKPKPKPQSTNAGGGVAGQLALATAQVRQAPPPAKAPRIILPGTAVTLWQQSGDARIELSGTAVDGGTMGSVVHVRTGPGRALLAGIVCGPGSVELIGLARQQWGRR